MLKVLIADDEVIICQMLRKMIDWKELDMEVTGFAHNGVEAVRLMEEEHPDIIISDIRMPGLDGLQIVQKSLDLGIKTDFIIMSGYKNFEYAHTALNLGVKHYLLKPINKQELHDTLCHIRQKRGEDEHVELEKQNLMEQALTGKQKIRKHFLSTIMNQSNIHVAEEEHADEVKENCEFSNGCFLAFVTKLDAESPSMDVKSLLNILDYQIEKNMDENICEYINSYVKSGVVSVVNYHENDRAQIQEMIARIYQMCRLELDKFAGYHLTIGIGSERGTITDVQSSISEAVECVKCRIQRGTDRMIEWSQLRYTPVTITEIIDERFGATIENECEVLDSASILEDMGIIFARLKRKVHYSPNVVFQIIDDFEERITKVWRKNQVSEELLSEFRKQLQMIADCNYNEEHLITAFRESIKQYFERVREEKRSTSQLPVRMAKQYIKENYVRQITLEEVADAIGLSPAYLSTLFKKEIGIGFSDYLISCRIEEGKRLLKEGNEPVGQIAEQVGYADARYFSKTFHKVVGLKPSEYRKLYQ